VSVLAHENGSCHEYRNDKYALFMEEPLRYETLTGLRHGQLHTLAVRIWARAGDVTREGGRPAAIGLFGSVAMVVALMRKNLTQQAAGAIFGVSQATVSRRWDLLRPLIGRVLAGCVPAPQQIAGRAGTLLVDGTVCPVWDWAAIPGLFSGKAGYTGMNVQLAATVSGQVAAIGPVPVRGARHDAYAFATSGLRELIAGMDAAADLGYTGVDGIAIVPFRTPPGGQLGESQAAFNTALSKIRAAVERAVAHLKTWRMLSEEGGRFRPPLPKFQETLTAITGLFFFSNYSETFE
jgi:DDE superfamily endonuclease